MFTGLVADLGEVRSIERTDEGARIEIGSPLGSELASGDSIAVNGCCLTATEPGPEGFGADVMNQTLTVTALGALEPGSPVNLEPALRAGDRLGGHIVQGHVDGVGTVTRTTPDGFARRVEIELPEDLRRYVIEHGSVALHGVSLTVSGLTPTGFEVSLIPETLERTTLGTVEPGASLNVEVDLMARYAERLMQGFTARLQ